MSKYDTGEGPSLLRELRSLRERVHTLETVNSLRNASLSDSGLRILDGGSIEVDGGRLVIRRSGVVVAVFGDTVGDGEAGGWALRRNSGSLASQMPLAYDIDGVGAQSWQWCDQSGNPLVAEDGSSGDALSRPYLAQALGSTDVRTWPATNQTSFVDMWTGYVVRTHAQFQLMAQTVGSSATGEFRITVDGVQVSTTRTIADGSVDAFWDGGLYPVGGAMTGHVLSLQGRVVTGTGTVQVGFFGMQGLQP